VLIQAGHMAQPSLEVPLRLNHNRLLLAGLRIGITTSNCDNSYRTWALLPCFLTSLPLWLRYSGVNDEC
jgi:hypothetical protein